MLCTLVYRYTRFGGDVCSCLQGGTKVKNTVVLRCEISINLQCRGYSVDGCSKSRYELTRHHIPKAGVLTIAAVITPYLITSLLLLPVIHCPSVRPSHDPNTDGSTTDTDSL
jgi:hypothetical protein